MTILVWRVPLTDFNRRAPLKLITRWYNQIILFNIFTATVGLLFICCCSLSVLRFEDILPFPTSIVCFKSLPLYTFPKAPCPIILSKRMSSKSTSNWSESSELDLKTFIHSLSLQLRKYLRWLPGVIIYRVTDAGLYGFFCGDVLNFFLWNFSKIFLLSKNRSDSYPWKTNSN